MDSHRKLARVLALFGVACLLAACGSPSPTPAPSQVAEPANGPPVTATPVGVVVAVGGRPEGIAVDAATGVVAVGLRSPSAIVVLDRGGHVLRRIAIPGAPRHLRFQASSGLLLVPAESANAVVLVDVTKGVVQSTVPVGRQPHDVVAAGERIFVSDEQANDISVIVSARLDRTLPAPTQPGGVAATAGTFAVLGVRSHTLEAFDAQSFATLGTAPAGTAPTHVVADNEGHLYVADTGGEAVLVYAVAPALSQIARLSVPGKPYGLALDPVRHRLWVTLTATNTLEEFDISGGQPKRLATFPSVRQPNSVAVDEKSGMVFVTGTADGVVQIVTPSM